MIEQGCFLFDGRIFFRRAQVFDNIDDDKPEDYHAGNGEKHSERAEQLTAEHYAEQNRQRMKVQVLSDDIWINNVVGYLSLNEVEYCNTDGNFHRKGRREQDAEAGGKCRSDYRYEFADAGKYGKDGGVGKMEKFKTGKDNGCGYDADGELAAYINPQ